ncbi:MAG: D-2-hydroxyacid dehydrogenase [Phycisphaerales bacterium]|nr:D-2-hydroxyacid dehydrogenase [Phycisphaerales bacterium]
MTRHPAIAPLLVVGLAVAAPFARAADAVDTAPPPPEAAAPAATPTATAEEIGSLRNAKVAIPRGAEAPTLTYFAYGLEPDEVAELQTLAPRVRIVNGLSRAEAVDRAAEAHAVDGFYATPEFLRAATNLVWVQATSAGVDRYVHVPELAGSDRIVLTNMRAVHGPAIADHVFAMLLALTRDLPVYLDRQADGEWNRQGSGTLKPIALADRTLLVVGLGGIGTEIAQRGHGFGMRVIATRRSSAGAPAFVERVGKPDELMAMLPEADVVAIAVPLTTETEGMFDAAAFAAMKPGSYLVNIARGKVVRSDALLEALRSGHLAGACLDVTDPEPLPSDDPLWRLPNVVITPHVAAMAELTQSRAWAVYRENLRRLDAGEPLLNVVDKSAEY